MAGKKGSARNYRKKSLNKAGMMAILAIVTAIGIFIAVQTGKVKERVEELKKTEALKQEQLDAEKARSVSLEEQRIYVKTMQYIEEKAREMGLVYPDEVLFVPDR